MQGCCISEGLQKAVLAKAQAWLSSGVPTRTYMPELVQADHRRLIEKSMTDAEEGTILVAAMPPDTGIMSIPGCWTILCEALEKRQVVCLVVRKGVPSGKEKYRFLIPGMWQVGDCYNLFRVFDALRARFGSCEFTFEHFMRKIVPDAVEMPATETAKIAWDGVIQYNIDLTEAGPKLYKTTHFYQYPIITAKRMGWLDGQPELPDRPAPYPITLQDRAWASKNVPFEKGHYVVLVPRAGYFTRDWDLPRWARLIQFLDESGWGVVVLGKEKLSFEIEGCFFRKLVNMTGHTDTIGQAAAVMDESALVVAPDTGLTHIAVGLGKPTLVLSGMTSAEMHYLSPAEAITRIDGGCVGCFNRPGNFDPSCGGYGHCMKAITVMQVIKAMADKLGIELDDRPTISLCMMVKNERKMLPGAIESARELVDEIIIVDTGSTDGTKEWLATQEDVNTYDFDVGEKIMSFSEVRNFAISKATSKYTIWMDACERLIDAPDLRKVLDLDHYDVYGLPICHSNIRYMREKIAPRIFSRFIDRVHEYMDTTGLHEVALPPQVGVLRLPYQKVNRESASDRNIRLLKIEIDEAPDNPRLPRWLFYLGRDLCDAGKFEEAVPYLERRLSLTGFWEERYAAGVLLCKTLLYNLKRFDKAFHIAASLEGLRRDAREWVYLVGESFYWQSKLDEAQRWFERALAVPRPQGSTFWVWEEVYTWLPFDRLSRIAEYQGKVEDAIEWAQKEYDAAPQCEREWMLKRMAELKAKVPVTA